MTSAFLLTLEAGLIPQMPLELGKGNCNLCLSKLERLNINATTPMAQGYIHHALALHHSITFTCFFFPPPLARRHLCHTKTGSPPSPISETNERTGQRWSNSTLLSNGLSWQLHLLAIEERQGCSHTLATDLHSRSLRR